MGYVLAEGNVSKNGRVRTPENLLHESVRTFIIIRINFFRTLEMNQRLVAIFQQERLNLSKSSKTCDILTCSLSVSFPNWTVAWIPNNLQAQWKSEAWQPLAETEWGWNSFRALFSDNCRYLIYLVVLGRPHSQSCLYLNWLGAYPLWRALIKHITAV